MATSSICCSALRDQLVAPHRQLRQFSLPMRASGEPGAGGCGDLRLGPCAPEAELVSPA